MSQDLVAAEDSASHFKTAPRYLKLKRMNSRTFRKVGKAGMAPALVHVNVPTLFANAVTVSNSATFKTNPCWRWAS